MTPGPVVVSKKKGGYMVARDYDRFEMTVDKATWFPVRSTMSLHGKVNLDVRLTDIQLGVPVDSAQFEPAFPKDVVVTPLDEGFRRVGIDEAAHAFNYRPLAPTSLPGRFSYSLSAVAPKAVFELWVGNLPPVSNRRRVATHDVTAIEYRGGLLSFTVTSRREGARTIHCWPTRSSRAGLGSESGGVRTVTLHHGALAGVRASCDAVVACRVWAFHDGFMVKIGGDLTAQQLLAVAESLEPLGQQ